MNKKDLEYFKKKLIEEKTALEEELAGVGQKNPNNPNDWEASATDMDVDSADENEVADKFEELEENSTIIKQLENQLNDVKEALYRIEKGTYGICDICGKPIENERLQANPSAKISIKHGHK